MNSSRLTFLKHDCCYCLVSRGSLYHLTAKLCHDINSDDSERRGSRSNKENAKVMRSEHQEKKLSIYCTFKSPASVNNITTEVKIKLCPLYPQAQHQTISVSADARPVAGGPRKAWRHRLPGMDSPHISRAHYMHVLIQGLSWEMVVTTSINLL